MKAHLRQIRFSSVCMGHAYLELPLSQDDSHFANAGGRVVAPDLVGCPEPHVHPAAGHFIQELGGIDRINEGAARVLARPEPSGHAHDRAFSGLNLSEVRVICVVETTGHEHVRQLLEALRRAGFAIVDS
jgi:hypothetical protein